MPRSSNGRIKDQSAASQPISNNFTAINYRCDRATRWVARTSTHLKLRRPPTIQPAQRRQPRAATTTSVPEYRTYLDSGARRVFILSDAAVDVHGIRFRIGWNVNVHCLINNFGL